MTKRCKRCNERVKIKNNFCANCGLKLNNSEEDYGLLGKNDFDEFSNMFSGMGGGMITKMLNGTMKMLEKEMEKEMKMQKSSPSKIRLMINGKEVFPLEEKKVEKEQKFLPIEFSKEDLEKWKNLKRKDPTSRLKREDEKIIYGIEMPDVNSVKDISIIKLEKSLEIRAIGKEFGYLKNVPIDLILRKYSLIKGILTLEFISKQNF